MLYLKDLGDVVVPIGCYTDPTQRRKAILAWLYYSLFPFLDALEISIRDEFRLSPQMLGFDVHVVNEWYKNRTSLAHVENAMNAYVADNPPDPFKFQIVINCTHPHMTWGTELDIAFDKREDEIRGELFDCYGFSIEQEWFNLDEQISLSGAQELIEEILIALRVDYVQKS